MNSNVNYFKEQDMTTSETNISITSGRAVRVGGLTVINMYGRDYGEGGNKFGTLDADLRPLEEVSTLAIEYSLADAGARVFRAIIGTDGVILLENYTPPELPALIYMSTSFSNIKL